MAARQTANDMGITNFDLVLYDDYDTVQMASDINEYVATSPQRSGILVSIPDDTVATAVKGAIALVSLSSVSILVCPMEMNWEY